MSGELLNRPRRRPTHCEMRTKRVAKDMYPDVLYVCASCRAQDESLDEALRQRI